MLSPEKIIEQIREDAPVVYNILNELYSFPITTFLVWDDWDKYYLDNPDKKPTADQLLELLSEYSEDNWDVHYWSGRYAQMIECEKEIQYWKDQYHYLDSRRTPDIDFV